MTASLSRYFFSVIFSCLALTPSVGAIEGSEPRIIKQTLAYRFSVRPDWREIKLNGSSPRFLFEASGTIFPPLYQNNPLIVTVAVLQLPAASLTEAKNKVLKSYSNFEDRVWEPNHRPKVKKIKLKDGEDAYDLETRFYRTTKGLYQNRYELVAYSKYKKFAVVISISIQHGDPGYQVEKKLNFKGKLVDPLFKSLGILKGVENPGDK